MLKIDLAVLPRLRATTKIGKSGELIFEIKERFLPSDSAVKFCIDSVRTSADSFQLDGWAFVSEFGVPPAAVIAIREARVAAVVTKYLVRTDVRDKFGLSVDSVGFSIAFPRKSEAVSILAFSNDGTYCEIYGLNKNAAA